MSIVTIFNKKFDKETRQDILFRTVLSNERIRWEKEESMTINGQGVVPTDTTSVFIPFSIEGYVKPKEYQSLENTSGKWTLQKGDIIIKGDIPYEKSETTLNKLYDDVCKIESIATNDFSKLEILKHFEVIAK